MPPKIGKQVFVEMQTSDCNGCLVTFEVELDIHSKSTDHLVVDSLTDLLQIYERKIETSGQGPTEGRQKDPGQW